MSGREYTRLVVLGFSGVCLAYGLNAPKLLWSPPVIELSSTELIFSPGQNPEENRRKVVRVDNPGGRELIIDGVQLSCSCVNVTISTNKIPSGGSGLLSFELDYPERGVKTVEAGVVSNDPSSPITRIVLTAECNSEVYALPPIAVMKSVSDEFLSSTIVRVRDLELFASGDLIVDSPCEFLKATTIKRTNESTFETVFKLDRTAPEGIYRIIAGLHIQGLRPQSGEVQVWADRYLSLLKSVTPAVFRVSESSRCEIIFKLSDRNLIKEIVSVKFDEHLKALVDFDKSASKITESGLSLVLHPRTACFVEEGPLDHPVDIGQVYVTVAKSNNENSILTVPLTVKR